MSTRQTLTLFLSVLLFVVVVVMMFSTKQRRFERSSLGALSFLRRASGKQYPNATASATPKATLAPGVTTTTDPLECKQCAVWKTKLESLGSITHSEYIRQIYIETVKRAVTGYVVRSDSTDAAFNEYNRFMGRDWPKFGFAMTGEKRLSMLQMALEQILLDGIDGDFIECGVWRGGTSMFARAVLNAYEMDKMVYVADSFQGLPKASITADHDGWAAMTALRVSVAQVQSNFERFELYDPKKVTFVVGFFNESMPKLRPSIKSLSVLRLDGDMYESCFDVINNLYDRLNVGGYLVVDDWAGLPCQGAIEVNEFRKELNITDTIVDIDTAAIYWRKTQTVTYEPKRLYDKYIVPRLIKAKTILKP